MQQKVSPAMIAAAVVVGILIIGVIGYIATRPSQDTVSKANAPAYARDMMNKSESGGPTNYGQTYSQGRHGYGAPGSGGPSSR